MDENHGSIQIRPRALHIKDKLDIVWSSRETHANDGELTTDKTVNRQAASQPMSGLSVINKSSAIFCSSLSAQRHQAMVTSLASASEMPNLQQFDILLSLSLRRNSLINDIQIALPEVQHDQNYQPQYTQLMQGSKYSMYSSYRSHNASLHEHVQYELNQQDKEWLTQEHIKDQVGISGAIVESVIDQLENEFVHTLQTKYPGIFKRSKYTTLIENDQKIDTQAIKRDIPNINDVMNADEVQNVLAASFSIPLSTVQTIYNYWLEQKEYSRSCPLQQSMQLDVPWKYVTYGDEFESSTGLSIPFKKQALDEEFYTNSGFCNLQELLAQYDALLTCRHNLDQVRSIIDLARKREKLQRQVIGTLFDKIPDASDPIIQSSLALGGAVGHPTHQEEQVNQEQPASALAAGDSCRLRSGHEGQKGYEASHQGVVRRGVKGEDQTESKGTDGGVQTIGMKGSAQGVCQTRQGSRAKGGTRAKGGASSTVEAEESIEGLGGGLLGVSEQDDANWRHVFAAWHMMHSNNKSNALDTLNTGAKHHDSTQTKPASKSPTKLTKKGLLKRHRPGSAGTTATTGRTAGTLKEGAEVGSNKTGSVGCASKATNARHSFRDTTGRFTKRVAIEEGCDARDRTATDVSKVHAPLGGCCEQGTGGVVGAGTRVGKQGCVKLSGCIEHESAGAQGMQVDGSHAQFGQCAGAGDVRECGAEVTAVAASTHDGQLGCRALKSQANPPQVAEQTAVLPVGTEHIPTHEGNADQHVKQQQDAPLVPGTDKIDNAAAGEKDAKPSGAASTAAAPVAPNTRHTRRALTHQQPAQSAANAPLTRYPATRHGTKLQNGLIAAQSDKGRQGSNKSGHVGNTNKSTNNRYMRIQVARRRKLSQLQKLRSQKSEESVQTARGINSRRSRQARRNSLNKQKLNNKALGVSQTRKGAAGTNTGGGVAKGMSEQGQFGDKVQALRSPHLKPRGEERGDCVQWVNEQAYDVMQDRVSPCTSHRNTVSDGSRGGGAEVAGVGGSQGDTCGTVDSGNSIECVAVKTVYQEAPPLQQRTLPSMYSKRKLRGDGRGGKWSGDVRQGNGQDAQYQVEHVDEPSKTRQQQQVQINNASNNKNAVGEGGGVGTSGLGAGGGRAKARASGQYTNNKKPSPNQQQSQLDCGLEPQGGIVKCTASGVRVKQRSRNVDGMGRNKQYKQQQLWQVMQIPELLGV